ncbi:hypothetical protein GGI35DRAFT_486815 [Trichoderma velutinum]
MDRLETRNAATSEPPMENLSLPINNQAAMLQLPLEIINLITSNLALHNKAYLSQTCTALRRILLCDWRQEASKLSPEDRFVFWEGIAHNSPNQWFCQKCCELHHVNSSAMQISRHNRLPCGAILRRQINLDGHCIQYHDVQFALKLSRLGNMEQRHFPLMMAPIHTKLKAMSPTHYSTEPKIIDRRFILREEWTVKGRSETYLHWNETVWPQTVRRWTLFQDESISVCPHLGLLDGLYKTRVKKTMISATIQSPSWTTTHRAITDLEDGIALAMELPDQWVFISCPRCPTDCGIIVSEGNKMATIQAWHDFGTEGPSSDISWELHLRRSIYKDWSDQGTNVNYVHGSIRALWLEDDISRRV